MNRKRCYCIITNLLVYKKTVYNKITTFFNTSKIQQNLKFYLALWYIKFIALLVFILLLFAEISTTTNQAFAEVYQNISYHYSIWYPPDWFVDGNGWSSIISLEPKIDSCKCTLLIVGAAAQLHNATLEHSKDIWISQAVIFEPVKNVTHITFLVIPAYKIVYASNLPHHEMVKIVTVKNGFEYSLDFDADNPQLPMIQKMIDSFQITQQ